MIYWLIDWLIDLASHKIPCCSINVTPVVSAVRNTLWTLNCVICPWHCLRPRGYAHRKLLVQSGADRMRTKRAQLGAIHKCARALSTSGKRNDVDRSPFTLFTPAAEMTLWLFPGHHLVYKHMLINVQSFDSSNVVLCRLINEQHRLHKPLQLQVDLRVLFSIISETYHLLVEDIMHWRYFTIVWRNTVNLSTCNLFTVPGNVIIRAAVVFLTQAFLFSLLIWTYWRLTYRQLGIFIFMSDSV